MAQQSPILVRNANASSEKQPPILVEVTNPEAFAPPPALPAFFRSSKRVTACTLHIMGQVDFTPLAVDGEWIKVRYRGLGPGIREFDGEIWVHPATMTEPCFVGWRAEV